MYDDIKYCAGGCETILWDLCMLPHRKYCDKCNKKLSIERVNIAWEKNREKYLKQQRERYNRKKLEIKKVKEMIHH